MSALITKEKRVILACGEALMDVFLRQGGGLARPAVFAMGGSPFNVAVALARQGVKAGFFGGLSGDAFGQMLRGILDAEGIDHTLSPPLPFKTTLAIVSRDTIGQPSYDFRGHEGADIMFGASHVPETLPDAYRAIVLSSYPMVVEPVRHAMLAIAQLAARDRLVSIDVNYRPALVGSSLLWAERFAPYEPLATIMKASEEDIALAYEGRRTPDAAAAHWLARGAALVLITRGADGASAYTAGGSLHAAAPRVTVVDTVGAGDCFHAGFLAALDRLGALSRDGIETLSAVNLQACLIRAIAAASLNVTREGTNPPTAAAIDAALALQDTGMPS